MPGRNDCHRLLSVGWILPVPLIVAFTPASEYHFQDFDEHPQSQYCNDYVSHITDLFLITTCKDTKKSQYERMYNVKYQLDEAFFWVDVWLFLIYAIPKSSISKMSVEPPGMLGCENLPYPISAGM